MLAAAASATLVSDEASAQQAPTVIGNATPQVYVNTQLLNSLGPGGYGYNPYGAAPYGYPAPYPAYPMPAPAPYAYGAQPPVAQAPMPSAQPGQPYYVTRPGTLLFPPNSYPNSQVTAPPQQAFQAAPQVTGQAPASQFVQPNLSAGPGIGSPVNLPRPPQYASQAEPPMAAPAETAPPPPAQTGAPPPPAMAEAPPSPSPSPSASSAPALPSIPPPSLDATSSAPPAPPPPQVAEAAEEPAPPPPALPEPTEPEPPVTASLDQPVAPPPPALEAQPSEAEEPLAPPPPALPSESESAATPPPAEPEPPAVASLAEPPPAPEPQPAPPAASEPAPAETQTAALTTGTMDEGAMRLSFGAGSADLDDGAKETLAALAKELMADGNARVQLLAYASSSDNSASRARRLSLSRALAVRAFLIDQGVRSTRMDVRALGDKSEGGPPDRVDILPARR